MDEPNATVHGTQYSYYRFPASDPARPDPTWPASSTHLGLEPEDLASSLYDLDQQQPLYHKPTSSTVPQRGVHSTHHVGASAGQEPANRTVRIRRPVTLGFGLEKLKGRKGKAPYSWYDRDDKPHEATTWAAKLSPLGLPRAVLTKALKHVGGPKTSKPVQDLQKGLALHGDANDLGPPNRAGRERLLRGAIRAAEEKTTADSNVGAGDNSYLEASGTVAQRVTEANALRAETSDAAQAFSSHTDASTTASDVDDKRTSASQMNGKLHEFSEELHRQWPRFQTATDLRNWLRRQSDTTAPSYRSSGTSHHTTASLKREAQTTREQHFRDLAGCFSLGDDVDMDDDTLASLIDQAINDVARGEARTATLENWKQVQADQIDGIVQLMEQNNCAGICAELENRPFYCQIRQSAFTTFEESRKQMANRQSMPFPGDGTRSWGTRGGIPALFLAVKLGLPRVCGVLLGAGATQDTKVAGSDVYHFAAQAVRQEKDHRLRVRIRECRLKVKFGLEQPTATGWADRKAQQKARAQHMQYVSRLDLCNKLDPAESRMQARRQHEMARSAISSQGFRGGQVLSGSSNAEHINTGISQGQDPAVPTVERESLPEVRFFRDLWDIKDHERHFLSFDTSANTLPLHATRGSFTGGGVASSGDQILSEPPYAYADFANSRPSGDHASVRHFQSAHTARAVPQPAENVTGFSSASVEQAGLPGLALSNSPESGFQSSEYSPCLPPRVYTLDETAWSSRQPAAKLSPEHTGVVEDAGEEPETRFRIPTSFTAAVYDTGAGPSDMIPRKVKRSFSQTIGPELQDAMAGQVPKLRRQYEMADASGAAEDTALSRGPTVCASTTTLQGDRVARLVGYYAARGEDRKIWVDFVLFFRVLDSLREQSVEGIRRLVKLDNRARYLNGATGLSWLLDARMGE